MEGCFDDGCHVALLCKILRVGILDRLPASETDSCASSSTRMVMKLVWYRTGMPLL